ncbi:CotH kinase family protein [Mucilaginibacter gynuensis]|uniref:CotH kinase family protein n=1 Tax=Mucilaginibacter gynuensis TaxID=1302236 RepID=A0ABP8G290_9SPHI
MNKFFTLLLVAILLWSCKKEHQAEVIEPEKPPVEIPDSAALVQVKFEAAKNPGKISGDVFATITGNEITALLPNLQQNKKLVATFTIKTASTKVNVKDTLVQSGTTVIDFSQPVVYTLTTPKGKTRNYNFTVRNFAGLPIFTITTEGGAPVDSKDTYVNATMSVNTNLNFVQEKTVIPLQIKGRGNSTWGHPKKPYRLKFTEKASMLGLTAAKNWVLLANYSDKTLIRTSIAFDLGAKLGSNYTPDTRYVDVVLNGTYLGSYLMTEQVEVNPGRVEITELKKGNTSAEEITGGYLLEQDGRLDADYWFRTNKKDVPLTFKSPDAPAQAQIDYIQQYMNDFETALYSDDFANPTTGYAKYINTDSFINWFIVQEIFSNVDARDFSSIFYYKDRGGKLGMGPLWDFDLSAGNNDYSDSRHPTGWWIKEGPYFSRLFQDPAFRAKFKARWNAVRNGAIQDIFTDIDATSAKINLSQRQNFITWPILNKYVWPNQFVMGTYPEEVKQLKKWLNERLVWMDGEISKF